MRQGRQDDGVPELAVDVEDNIIFRDDGLDSVLDDDVDVDTTTVTAAEMNNRDPTTSSPTTETSSTSSYVTTTTTTTIAVTTSSSSLNPTVTPLPRSTTTTAPAPTESILRAAAPSFTIQGRLGPGYTAAEEEEEEAAPDLGPRPLQLCLPLTRPECGLLGDQAVWRDVLAYIEVRGCGHRHPGQLCVAGRAHPRQPRHAEAEHAAGGRHGEAARRRHPGPRLPLRLPGPDSAQRRARPGEHRRVRKIFNIDTININDCHIRFPACPDTAAMRGSRVTASMVTR